MYIDAIHDRQRDLIRVVERNESGERIFRDIPANYTFYYSHGAGSFTSIFGNPCKRFTTTNGQRFRRELKRIRGETKRDGTPKHKIFESDINPVFRSLSENYMGAKTPKFHIGFFDIEADFHPVFGYAPTEDPFNAVTAISLHHSRFDALFTLALCPPTMSIEEARKIAEPFENTMVFDDEKDLLQAFLLLIEDVDVLTGWNSEGYDIPYLVNRIKRKLGEAAAKKLCLWEQSPREREYIKFGKTALTYDLVGRVHLDYLLLYQKHNTQQQHSYRLDYIGEIEVNRNKVAYEGTLDDLYKRDFYKFIDYNRQDVDLLVAIDAKRKFIELANRIAHDNCILLKTTMGSVALVEQAIINDMHAMGFVVPDRKERVEEAMPVAFSTVYDDEDDDDEVEVGEKGRVPVVGAYVAPPRVGIHRHIGAIDINSLYPSAIRSLNMSPETIVGQVRLIDTMALVEQRIANNVARAEAWDGLFHTLEVGYMHERTDDQVTVDFEDGTTKVMTGAQLHDYIFNPKNNVCITANGTILRTDKDGMIPVLLARWYAERKANQGEEKRYGAMAAGVKVPADLAKRVQDRFVPGTVMSTEYDAKALADHVEADEAEAIAAMMAAHDLVFSEDGTKLLPRDPEPFSVLSAEFHFLQYAGKIRLNSLYGALLNVACRFHDERIGQSTTLTGRSIVRHMLSQTNMVLTGEYDHRGDAIVYADTDSCYFSAVPILERDERFKDFDWTKESFIELYDMIADTVNDTFPEFMHKTFNTSLERGAIIAAGREIVASTGLFIKKKKYACLVYDLEGHRQDVNGKPGKLKVMGLDLKRADTPKFMQKFLEEILISILTGVEKEELYEVVKDFRETFTERPSWEKGSPKAVKNLTKNRELLESSQKLDLLGKRKAGTKAKVNMPGHVRASLNWNALRAENNDLHTMEITDGSRIVVCRLIPNSYDMQSVAFPIDEPHLPEWFKSLPFDDDEMENIIIDKKLDNLVGVLDWCLADTRRRGSDEFFS